MSASPSRRRFLLGAAALAAAPAAPPTTVAPRRATDLRPRQRMRRSCASGHRSGGRREGDAALPADRRGPRPHGICRYFGERDRINHVHYRNVRVRRPYVDYTEVFPDEGEVDMFAVMKELVRLGYSRALYPEHPRALDADRERPGFGPSYPGGGGYAGLVYNVAYTKAMLQAALSS